MNDEQKATAKDFKKEFDKCPACGGKERFFETIVKELKERGLARQEWNFYLDMKSGIVADSTKEASMLIGSELPAYSFATDICSDCGLIYVVKLQRLTAKKSVPIPTPIPMNFNRATRRRMENGRQSPFGNNPLSS